jgi:hypothetical protein
VKVIFIGNVCKSVDMPKFLLKNPLLQIMNTQGNAIPRIASVQKNKAVQEDWNFT